jgi:leucyl/phenylalanyl-tRNA---protein transferase
VIPWLDSNTPFPHLETALAEPNGLLAAGGDLSPRRLIMAYSMGIFPWYSDDAPILWWSPDPRMVLFVEEFQVSKSMRKFIRKTPIQIRINTAFQAVLVNCAEPRNGQNGTWIGADMQKAYVNLHKLGFAHSVEAWLDNELVGGLYGVQIGRMFYGESMFTRVANASKFALVYLITQLHQKGFPMVDCQQETDHLASMGARPIARAEFAKCIGPLVQVQPQPKLFA